MGLGHALHMRFCYSDHPLLLLEDGYIILCVDAQNMELIIILLLMCSYDGLCMFAGLGLSFVPLMLATCNLGTICLLY
jgi:hypothetical protein